MNAGESFQVQNCLPFGARYASLAKELALARCWSKRIEAEMRRARYSAHGRAPSSYIELYGVHIWSYVEFDIIWFLMISAPLVTFCRCRHNSHHMITDGELTCLGMSRYVMISHDMTRSLDVLPISIRISFNSTHSMCCDRLDTLSGSGSGFTCALASPFQTSKPLKLWMNCFWHLLTGLVTSLEVLQGNFIDWYGLSQLLIQHGEAWFKPYSAILWQSLTWRKDQKFPTSLICVIYTIWSQSACPETPETPETLKTPETLATPLADRGLGTCIGRGPAAWHAPHAVPRRSRWSGRESSSGPESMASSLCQLTSAYVSYVNVDFMIQKTNILRTKKRVPVCRSMPEDVHTAASQKTHSGATVPRPQRGLLHAPAGSLR